MKSSSFKKLQGGLGVDSDDAPSCMAVGSGSFPHPPIARITRFLGPRQAGEWLRMVETFPCSDRAKRGFGWQSYLILFRLAVDGSSGVRGGIP